jgi:predicted DCC family thiol-disulfide oxidoreductase YuxK
MPARNGTLFFDAGCGLCSASVLRWKRIFDRAGVELIPLQDPRAWTALDMDPSVLPGEVKLKTPQGDILGGVDAFGHVARHVWWAFPFHLLMRIPLTRELARLAYAPIGAASARPAG